MGLLNMMGRMGRGAVAGGVIGGISSGGDMSGIAGGAAGGAAFGMLGWGAMSRLGGRTTNIAASGLIGAGSLGKRFTKALGDKAATLASNKGYGLGAASRVSSLFNSAVSADRGLTRAASFLGANQMSINKWGSRAAVAAGLGASAYLGSSLINSNRGYLR